MDIGIIGCGWLGFRLARSLSKKHRIYSTTTSVLKQAELNKQHVHAAIVQFSDEGHGSHAVWEIIQQLDAIVISVPFSKRTELKKLQYRFENLVRFLGNYKQPLFLLSSIGVYPAVPALITESNIPEDELHPNIRYVEQLMQFHFPQVSVLRLAGLMGDDRYLSKYLTAPANEPVNHVHYEDICLILEKMVEGSMVSGLFNVVAPLHPGKQAVVNYENGNSALPDTEETTERGRIVSSVKLETELPYQYKHKDPMYFKRAAAL